RQEITREIEQFLRVVFQERRNTGRLDLEATEMAMRSALHRAGATALSQLLQFPAPSEEGRRLACPCGQQAHYRVQRSKPVLPSWARWKFYVPIIYAHTAASANFRWMSN